ncbi:MAG: putative transposase [Algoriphagus sp.]|jgi:putative transposase
MIIKGHSLVIPKQCELLGINRSSYYYQSHGESSLNLELMRLAFRRILQFRSKPQLQ